LSRVDAQTAQGGSTAPDSVNTCDASVHITISPGASMTPSQGSIGSYRLDEEGNRVETPGTINCIGTIADAPVTGPGQLWLDGIYGDGLAGRLQGGDNRVYGEGQVT
jgi:hypothetical protein